MRRSVLNALATVSLAALVGVATSSQASTPASLGTLKQTDKWKVGIVDPEGQSFCAMVNKFDHNVGLAFALSPEGYGSVAVDVATASFTPGEVYQVTLSTNGAPAGTFPGRATSPRSVVVQIGQNTKVYDDLKANAPLGIGLPKFDAQFTLGKFAASYRQLVDCSQTLTGVRGNDGRMPAVKVKEVEKQALAPLDRELADISGDAQVDNAPAVNDKDAAFDDAGATPDKTLDKTLDKAAVKAKTSLAALQAQQAVATISDQKEKTVSAPLPAPKPERIMLASTKTPAANVPPATDSGATAKLWDETQETNSQKQAELDREQEEASARTAALNAAQAKAAAEKPILVTKTATVQITEPAKIVSKPVVAADDSALKAALAAKQAEIARVNAESAKQAQELNNKLAATQSNYQSQISAKQAEIARVNAERAKQTQELNSKLATTQSNYQSQISAVAAERDALKKQLADAKSEAEFGKARVALLQTQINTAAKQGQKAQSDAAKLESLQTQLSKSEEQRQALEGQLAATSKQTKLLGATLSQKQQQLEATSASAKEIAAAKAEADRLRAENTAAVESLKRQLASQGSEFANLQNQYDQLQKQNQTIVASANNATAKAKSDLSGELSRKEAYVSELEQKLAAAESERAAAAAAAATEKTRAEKVQADLAVARKDSTSARKSLVIINDDELPVSLTKKPTAEEAAAAAQKDAELSSSRNRVSQLERQLETTRQQVAELQKQQSGLTAQEKVATAVTTPNRPSLVIINNDPAAIEPAAGDTQQVGSDQHAKLAAAQAEIDRLKKGNEELATKLLLASDPDMPKAGKGAVEEEQALNDQRAKLEAAQAEINRLKQGNEQLLTNASVTPDAATTAELATTRSHAAALERQLQEAHAAQAIQKQLPAPIGRPTFFAPVQEASTADSEDLSPVVSPRPSRKPGTVHVPHAQVAKADADIDVTREIAGVEPAAGDNIPVPPLPAPRRAPAPAPQAVAYTAETPVYGAKVTPILRGAPEPVDNDPGFNANRAAAFLDRIMAYHRPGGVKKSPAPETEVAENDATPVFQVTHRPAARTRPVVAVAQPVQTLSQIETAAGPAPEAYAPVPQPAAPHGYTGARHIAAMQQPVRQQPVMQQPVVQQAPVDDGQEFPAPVTAVPLHDETPVSAPVFTRAPAPVRVQAPVAVAAPVSAPIHASPKGAAAILADAGISDATPSTPQTDEDGVTVQNWTTEGISGMLETSPVHGDFATNVSSYINRYREDCPALHVGMGATQQSAAGKIEQADISCPTAGNTYSTSFVFWQDRKNFNALLHSGYPSDASKVTALGNNIAQALGGTASTAGISSVSGADVGGGSLSPADDVKQADAAVEQYADRPQHHFNIPQTPSASSTSTTYTTGGAFGQRPAFAPPANAPHGGNQGGDFDTVVIE